MDEVVAFEEQRFAFDACESVGKAIAEVQVGSVTAAAAVVAVGLAGDSGLIGGEGLDQNVCRFENGIEAR